METNNRGQPENPARLPLPLYVEGYDDSKVPVLYGRLSQGEGDKRQESDIGFYFPLPEDVAERTLDQSGLDRSQPINLHLGAITEPEEILSVIGERLTISPKGSPIRDLNEMCEAVAKLSSFGKEKLGAVISLVKPSSAWQIAWLTNRLDAFEYEPHARTPKDYAQAKADLKAMFGESINAREFHRYERKAAAWEKSGTIQFNNRGCVECDFLDEMKRRMRAEESASRLGNLQGWEKYVTANKLRSNIADYIRRNATQLSDREISDAYNHSHIIQAEWHGRTYEMSYVNGELTSLRKREEHEYHTLRSPRRLAPENIEIYDEVIQQGRNLNFYMNVWAGIDELLGPLAEEESGFEYADCYANFNMETGCVCDTLTIIVTRSDDTKAECAYWLNPAEKAILREKMDAWCREETGRSLAVCSRHYREGKAMGERYIDVFHREDRTSQTLRDHPRPQERKPQKHKRAER